MKRNWVRVALWFLCLQKLLQSLEDILKTCHFSTFISSDVSETSIKVSILPSSPVPFHYLPLQDTEVQIVDIFERIQAESDHFPQPSFWAEFCCLMPHCSCNMWENPGKSIWLQFFSEDPCYRILLGWPSAPEILTASYLGGTKWPQIVSATILHGCQIAIGTSNSLGTNKNSSLWSFPPTSRKMVLPMGYTSNMAMLCHFDRGNDVDLGLTYLCPGLPSAKFLHKLQETYYEYVNQYPVSMSITTTPSEWIEIS